MLRVVLKWFLLALLMYVKQMFPTTRVNLIGYVMWFQDPRLFLLGRQLNREILFVRQSRDILPDYGILYISLLTMTNMWQFLTSGRGFFELIIFGVLWILGWACICSTKIWCASRIPWCISSLILILAGRWYCLVLFCLLSYCMWLFWQVQGS